MPIRREDSVATANRLARAALPSVAEVTMGDQRKSRAFDPTYVPTKTMQQLAAEHPQLKGVQMLAERERLLTEQRAAFGGWDRPAATNEASR
jgi:hypothetical protein